MHAFARVIRSIAKARFRLLGLATIKDIPSARFVPLFKFLEADGWRIYRQYKGFDAGIDYDCVRLRKGFATLKCEWDNWSEWSVEGRRELIDELAQRSELPVTYAWRWSVHDDEKLNA